MMYVVEKKSCTFFVISFLFLILSCFIRASPQEKKLESSNNNVCEHPKHLSSPPSKMCNGCESRVASFRDSGKEQPYQCEKDSNDHTLCLNARVSIKLPNEKPTAYDLPLCHSTQKCSLPEIPNVGTLKYRWEKRSGEKILLHFYFDNFKSAIRTSEYNPRLKCLPIISFLDESQQTCYICQDENHFKKDDDLYYAFGIPDSLSKAQLPKEFIHNPEVREKTKPTDSEPHKEFNPKEKPYHGTSATIHFSSGSTKEKNIEELTITLKPWQLLHQLSDTTALNMAAFEALQQHNYFKDFNVYLWRSEHGAHTIVISFEPKQQLAPDHRDYNRFEMYKRNQKPCPVHQDLQLSIPRWGKSISIDCDEFSDNDITIVKINKSTRQNFQKVLMGFFYPFEDLFSNGLKKNGWSWKPNAANGFEFLTTLICNQLCKGIRSEGIRDLVQINTLILNCATNKLQKSKENAFKKPSLHIKKTSQEKEKGKEKENKQTRLGICLRSLQTVAKTLMKCKKFITGMNLSYMLHTASAGDSSSTAENSVQVIEINDVNILNQIGRNASYPINGYYQLTGNIDASGFTQSIKIFEGTLYGQGFTISHLTCCLIEKITSTAFITNINFCNADITDSSSICASVLAGIIESNSVVIGINVYDSQIKSTNQYIGSVATVVQGESRLYNILTNNVRITATSKQEIHGGVVTGNLSEHASIVNIVAIDCSIHGNAWVTEVAIGAGRITNYALINNLKAFNCKVTSSESFGIAGITVGSALSDTVIYVTQAIDCEVITKGECVYSGIGAGYAGGNVKISTTTAFNCIVTTSGEITVSGVGAGYVSNNGSVISTTAISSRVEAIGNKKQFASVGIGTGLLDKNHAKIIDNTHEKAVDCKLKTTEIIDCTLDKHNPICNMEVVCHVTINGHPLDNKNAENRSFLCYKNLHPYFTNNDCSLNKKNVEVFIKKQSSPAECVPDNIPTYNGINVGIIVGTVVTVSTLVACYKLYQYYKTKSNKQKVSTDEEQIPLLEQ